MGGKDIVSWLQGREEEGGTIGPADCCLGWCWVSCEGDFNLGRKALTALTSLFTF